MIIAAIIFLLLLCGSAGAATRVVSPGGSGSTCSQASPCSLATGMSQAIAGDTVLLKDGTYATTLVTVNNGTASQPITVTAENTHQAIVQGGSSFLADIKHSYYVISKIDFDAGNTRGQNGAIKFCSANNCTPMPHHVTIDNVIVQNMYSSGFHISFQQTDITIQNSLIKDAGNGVYWGECFYLSSASNSAATVSRLKILNNTIDNCTENAIDGHNYINDSLIEGNIIKNQVTAEDKGVAQAGRTNQGTIYISGCNNIVRKNILFNNKGGFGAILVRGDQNNQVYQNIVYNSVAETTYPVRRIDFGGSNCSGAVSWVENNTFFNNPTDTVGSASAALRVHNNLGVNATGNTPAASLNSSHFVDSANGNFALTSTNPGINAGTSCKFAFNGSSCDRGAHETIGFVSGEVGLIDSTTVRLTFQNNLFPPLLPASICTGFTVQEDTGGGFVSKTNSSCTRVGTNVVDVVVSSAFTGGSSARFSYLTSTGNVSDSALIGGTNNQRLNAITNQSITNNVGGSPTHVFTQSDFQFTRENNQIDTNTHISLVPGSILLVGSQVNCTGADCPALGMVLRYNVDGGAYSAIADSFGADNLKFFGNSVSSPFMPIEGTAVSSCLTATAGNDVAGAIQRTSNAVPNVNLAQNDCTHNRYGIVFDDDAELGKIYCFRNYNQTGAALNAYSQTGCATIVAFPGVEAGLRTQAVGRPQATGRTQAGIRSQVIQ